jgi:hypothetical protein
MSDQGDQAFNETPFRTFIRFERFRRLYDYWHEKRGTRAMPSRADIDPLELKGVLGWVLLLDVDWSGPRLRPSAEWT